MFRRMDGNSGKSPINKLITSVSDAMFDICMFYEKTEKGK